MVSGDDAHALCNWLVANLHILFYRNF